MVAQNRIIGVVPRRCHVVGVRIYGQTAVTATTLTADLFARTVAGAAGASLLASVMDIDFATAAAALAGVTGALTATGADLRLVEGQLLEMVIAVSSATVGPGDVIIEVDFEPLFP